jgi:hypothetical protein
MGTPLLPGERLSLRGVPLRAGTVAVRARDGDEALEALFTNLDERDLRLAALIAHAGNGHVSVTLELPSGAELDPAAVRRIIDG